MTGMASARVEPETSVMVACGARIFGTVRRVASDDPSTFNWLSFGIAAGAFVLAVCSLAWQWATWVLSGSRAKAELGHGAIHPLSKRYVILSAKTPLTDYTDVAQYGLTDRALFVSVNNSGRLPLAVTRWQVGFPGKIRIGDIGGEGPKLPHRLDVAESATWAIGLDFVFHGAEMVRRQKGIDAVPVHVEVSLGNGKTITTKEKIVIQPADLQAFREADESSDGSSDTELADN